MGRDERMQPVTLIFDLGGVEWKQVNPQGGDQAAGLRDVLQDYRPLSKRAIAPDANLQLNTDGTAMVNAIDILDVDGRSAESLANARTIAIAESSHFTAFLRTHVPGFEHAYIARFAGEMYVRETRHVRGLSWIDAQYIWSGERPYDTVTLAAYPLDVHPVHMGDHGGVGWAEVSHVYGIPLRALVVSGFSNLAVVGPAISATHDASGSVRVLPDDCRGRIRGRRVRAEHRPRIRLAAHRALSADGGRSAAQFGPNFRVGARKINGPRRLAKPVSANARNRSATAVSCR